MNIRQDSIRRAQRGTRLVRASAAVSLAYAVGPRWAGGAADPVAAAHDAPLEWAATKAPRTAL
jgi:hypothetical protein